ncbi:MAG: hypothetical protein WBX17_11515 [Microbacterium sp.]
MPHMDQSRYEIPTPTPDRPVRLSGAAPSLWRVIDASGRVIGHVQALVQADGVRFRARRFRAATRAFMDLGEFWSVDDAVDCLRFGR